MVVVLFDRRDLGIVAYRAADLVHECLGDHVHAADRLKERRLEIVDLAEGEAIPHARAQAQDFGEREGLRRGCLAA